MLPIGTDCVCATATTATSYQKQKDHQAKKQNQFFHVKPHVCYWYIGLSDAHRMMKTPILETIDVQKIIWGWLVVTTLVVQRGTAKAVTTNPKSFS